MRANSVIQLVSQVVPLFVEKACWARISLAPGLGLALQREAAATKLLALQSR